MVILSKHARRRSVERAIPPAWIEAAIERPDRTARDALDPSVMHSFRAVPEAGGRVLKVVHKPAGDDVLVVTVHLDRGAKS